MKQIQYLMFFAFILLSCAKQKPPAEPQQQPPPSIEEELPTEVGKALIGTQCPHGSFSSPHSTALNLWDCKLPGEAKIELLQPPQTLMLQIDCKKKWLSVRSPERGPEKEKIDLTWEVLPDGTFNIIAPGGSVSIKSTDPLVATCTSFTELEITGKVDCSNRDRAQITLEPIIWWLNKGKPYPGFQGVLCTSLPSGCYLGSQISLQQCP